MRVTNDTLRTAFLFSLEQAQQRILRTQTQVSTGQRINQPSDDPFASARIGELGASLAKLEQYQANGATAQTRLGLTEEAYAAIISDLQRVRELTLQANSDTVSSSDRAAISAEIDQRFQSIVGRANAQDASGNYLFAGYSEATKPFTVAPAGVTYSGDDGQRFLQISDNRFVAVNDAGSEVFQRITNGNGTFSLAASAANTGTGVLGRGTVTNPPLYVPGNYTITFVTAVDYDVRDGGGVLVASGTYAPGQALTLPGASIELSGQPAAGDAFTITPSTNRDLFSTVQGLVSALGTPTAGGASSALLHNRVGQGLVDLDRAIDHLIDLRSGVGARLQAIEQEASLIDGFSAQLTDTLSELRDLDYAEALSLLAQQLFGLEASQQAYARTQNLSLFRYL